MATVQKRALFWWLMAGQAACSQFLIWSSLPVYHQIRTGSIHGASLGNFAFALGAVVLMQACHWPSIGLRRGLEFQRNAVLGHVLIWVGELSLFFSAALVTLIVFDRYGEVEWLWWKVLIMAAILFAVTSYKYQLMSIGEAMIEAEDK